MKRLPKNKVLMVTGISRFIFPLIINRNWNIFKVVVLNFGNFLSLNCVKYYSLPILVPKKIRRGNIYIFEPQKYH